MDYTVFGPFNLDEARALSTAYPEECLPWGWGDKTHLESVGSTVIKNAGIKYKHLRSRHSENESTTQYMGTKIVQCHIEKPISRFNFETLDGYFIMEQNLAERFQEGLIMLLNDKLDLESELNIQHRNIKNNIKQDLEQKKIKYENRLTDDDKEYLKLISLSKILEEPDICVLHDLSMKLKNGITKDLEAKGLNTFLDKIYIGNTSMPTLKKGTILYYFGLPVKHLIAKSIDESVARWKNTEGFEQYDLRFDFMSVKEQKGETGLIDYLFGYK